MIKEILYKWLGLEPIPCATCEVLREQLLQSNAERRELLARLLDKEKVEPPQSIPEEGLKPVGQTFIPWRVRQQMLESEDRKKAQLTRDKQKEIDDLEKELGVKVNASEI